jgi:hypothetical protein
MPNVCEGWGDAGSLRESNNGLAERIKRLGKREEHTPFIFKSMCRKAKEVMLLNSGATKKFLDHQIVSHQNIGMKGYMHQGHKKSTMWIALRTSANHHKVKMVAGGLGLSLAKVL